MKLSSQDIKFLFVLNKLDNSINARAYVALLLAENLEYSYCEICRSFNNLLGSGLIKKISKKLLVEGVAITSKGRAVIAYTLGQNGGKAAVGKQIAEEEFETSSEIMPFSEDEWNWAVESLKRESSWYKSPANLAKKYAVSKWKPFLAIIFLILSLAWLATGISFACFSWLAVKWRIVVPILGVVFYIVFGMVCYLLVTSRVKYAFQKFIFISCLPSGGLGLLLCQIFQYAPGA